MGSLQCLTNWPCLGGYPNQTAVQKIFYQETRPISNIQGSNALVEFLISGNGPHYIDLKCSRLFLKARLVKAYGSSGAAAEKTGIANLPRHALFSQIEIYFNGLVVSSANNHYPWKSFIKTILSTGSE